VNWRDFIASLIDSLAWPGAVVVLILLLRQHIGELLRRPMSRLSVGPLEVEWDRTVVATLRELEAPPSARNGGMDVPPGSVITDLWRLADVAPAAVVVEGFSRIGQALARRLGAGLDDVPRASPRELARLAREHDLITDETVRAIDGLAALRNIAAHLPDDKEITSTEATEYLRLVEAVLYAVSTGMKPDDPDSQRPE
jgi:hypothetical protein